MTDVVLQGTPLDGGAIVLSGKARCGKTTSGVDLMNADSRRTGFPKILLDLGRAKSLAHLPHAGGCDEVLDFVYIKREPASFIVWTPTERERPKFWTTIAKWGGVHVFGDEIWNICNSYYVDEDMVTASNQFAHGKFGPNFLYYTCQRLTYVNPKLYGAVMKWRIFRSANGAEQDVLRRMFGPGPWRTNLGRESGNLTMQRGEYAEFSEAFEDHPTETPADVPHPGAPLDGGVPPEDRGRDAEAEPQRPGGTH